MSVTVRIPGTMRALAQGRAEVDVEPGSVRQVLEALGRHWPELHARLLGEDGELRGPLNVFVNDEDVRFRERLETPVRDGDRVTIVPAIAGGW